ncbi:MAG: hypothetical protein JSR17_07970 [Proteobacteria bacterium]|nr:hypothetical protein [Pseudomonadota bacterium]
MSHKPLQLLQSQASVVTEGLAYERNMRKYQDSLRSLQAAELALKEDIEHKSQQLTNDIREMAVEFNILKTEHIHIEFELKQITHPGWLSQIYANWQQMSMLKQVQSALGLHQTPNADGIFKTALEISLLKNAVQDTNQKAHTFATKLETVSESSSKLTDTLGKVEILLNKVIRIEATCQEVANNFHTLSEQQKKLIDVHEQVKGHEEIIASLENAAPRKDSLVSAVLEISKGQTPESGIKPVSLKMTDVITSNESSLFHQDTAQTNANSAQMVTTLHTAELAITTVTEN